MSKEKQKSLEEMSSIYEYMAYIYGQDYSEYQQMENGTDKIQLEQTMLEELTETPDHLEQQRADNIQRCIRNLRNHNSW